MLQNDMKSHISNYELYSLRCEIMKHFLCNMYVDLVYQLKMLVHDKLRPCALDLHFFDVFWISFEYFKSGSTKVNRIWNIQKILKKHQKNANPVHMALVYHVLTSPTDKQVPHTNWIGNASIWCEITHFKQWTLMCEERWFGICNMKFTKNSPKLHFGLTKKDPGLVFHFGV